MDYLEGLYIQCVAEMYDYILQAGCTEIIKDTLFLNIEEKIRESLHRIIDTL